MKNKRSRSRHSHSHHFLGDLCSCALHCNQGFLNTLGLSHLFIVKIKNNKIKNIFTIKMLHTLTDLAICGLYNKAKRKLVMKLWKIYLILP